MKISAVFSPIVRLYVWLVDALLANLPESLCEHDGFDVASGDECPHCKWSPSCDAW